MYSQFICPQEMDNSSYQNSLQRSWTEVCFHLPALYLYASCPHRPKRESSDLVWEVPEWLSFKEKGKDSKREVFINVWIPNVWPSNPQINASECTEYPSTSFYTVPWIHYLYFIISFQSLDEWINSSVGLPILRRTVRMCCDIPAQGVNPQPSMSRTVCNNWPPCTLEESKAIPEWSLLYPYRFIASDAGPLLSTRVFLNNHGEVLGR